MVIDVVNVICKPCLFLITYSFDTEYIAHFCKDREQAEKIRAYYISNERDVVQREKGYDPYIDRTDPNNWILWYVDDSMDREYAEYRIISGDNYTSYAEEQLKLKGII